MAAVDAGSHFCDLGGNTEIVLQQKELHERARERGVSVIPDCGLAPGMVNILAEHGIRQLDRPRSVRIKVGGLPQHPRAAAELPGGLQPGGGARLLHHPLLGAARRRARAGGGALGGRGARLPRRRAPGGLPHRRRPLHHGAALPRRAGDAWSTRRSATPATPPSMRTIRDLGLLDLEPVEVDGHAGGPARRSSSPSSGPQLAGDPRESPDLVALRVEVEGEKDGARRHPPLGPPRPLRRRRPASPP